MKKIKRGIAFIISAILGLFTSVVTTSCGGDMYMGPPMSPEMYGKVMDATTDEGIAGIRIELLKGGTNIGSTSTYTNGHYNIRAEGENIEVRVTDVDGIINGEYKGTTNTVSISNNLEQNYKLTHKN